MKLRYLITLAAVVLTQVVLACPVCEKQQPAITRGITHGAGPSGNWDWAIVGIISVLVLLTLFYSAKYLIRPGEKDENHIKQAFLK